MILPRSSRVGDCSARLNYCPLGSGAVAGATLVLDRTIAARELVYSTRQRRRRMPPGVLAISFSKCHHRKPFHACWLAHKTRFAEEVTLATGGRVRIYFVRGRYDQQTRCHTEESGLTRAGRKKLTVSMELHRLSHFAVERPASLPTVGMQETQEPTFSVDFVPQMLGASLASRAALQPRSHADHHPIPEYLNAAAAAYLVPGEFPSRPTRRSAYTFSSRSRKATDFRRVEVKELKQFWRRDKGFMPTTISLQRRLLTATTSSREHARKQVHQLSMTLQRAFSIPYAGSASMGA